MYFSVHGIAQRIVNQTMSLNQRFTRKCIGNDINGKVPRAAGTGVSDMLVTLVNDIQALRRKYLGQAFLDHGYAFSGHQGSTFLNGFTVTRW
jgi:hypothetical protein